MTTELYLILHKVRGEPAYDIAQMVEIGKEVGWIIPTSGHRAYPSEAWSMDALVTTHDLPPIDLRSVDDPRWAELPDHYDVKRDDGSHLVNAAREILMRKGLISAAKPAQPAYRRV